MSTANNNWPSLPLAEWQETYKALHLWSQILGKIQLRLTPLVNHWWNTALHLTSTGFATDLIHHSKGCFYIGFDLVRHKMIIEMEDGRKQELELKNRSVADFYRETMRMLGSLGIEVKIWTQPVEMEYKVHFEKDEVVREFNPEHANRFWKILLETEKVMRQFRSKFKGKSSPYNFFWGSFDLALTFFSGRPAPEHPGAPNVGKQVMVEAYSKECSSVGFWPGMGLGIDKPVFYAYSYPAPAGYGDWAIQPGKAFFHKDMGEFILPYDDLRNTADPAAALLSFFESAFSAAATLANWDKSLYIYDAIPEGKNMGLN